jgi:hypothetical protein
MRRLAKTTASGVFRPPPPHDFVGRAEALEVPLQHADGESGQRAAPRRAGLRQVHARAPVLPGRRRGAFDAVVFQLCGRRPVHEIAAELGAKIKLGVETRPPEEQIAAARGMACWAPGSAGAG